MYFVFQTKNWFSDETCMHTKLVETKLIVEICCKKRTLHFKTIKHPTWKPLVSCIRINCLLTYTQIGINKEHHHPGNQTSWVDRQHHKEHCYVILIVI